MKLGRIFRNSILSCIAILHIHSAPASPEDGTGEIFPATPAAKSAVDWKDGYFYINGQPTFIASGSIHYARVPRELWRDRVWRLKMMGFNCVQSYIFWNATEPKEGVWDFTDNVDLDGWYSLLKEMDMYALARVGPYSCAEWEEGGYPAWLTVKPGMTERGMGPSVPYSDAHLAKIEGIVAKQQVNHGGPVFMVQLENEHSRGWGTQVFDPYLKYLDDQARANGIEVPMFNSGLHHSQDPAGEIPFPVDPSPWYSTEFWTGWIGRYGEMTPGTLQEKIRGTWKIIAFGGAGYNYYMAHGGTNFGYSGDGELPGVSYDYSAPIGEAGQLRNFYFSARRAAYFARSFIRLLAGSHNDPTFATSDQPAVRVTSRTNPAGGHFIMLDHFSRKSGAGPVAWIAPDASAYHAPPADSNGALPTRVIAGGIPLPHQGTLKVASDEPATVIVDMPWTANAKFESICTNVMLRAAIGASDYWVCYGPAGDSGEVTLALKQKGAGPSQFDFTYPAGETVSQLNLDSGDGHQARLLIMNSDMTKRTWFANGKLYIGPSFVFEDGRMEFPPAGGKATVYSASGKSEVEQPPVAIPALPLLSNWTWRDGAPERLPQPPAEEWLKSQGPQPMQTYDSFENRYGWYRATMHLDLPGAVSLHFARQSGTILPYLNGQPGTPVTLAYGQAGNIQLPSALAGDNTLAILVKAGPRSKSLSSMPGDLKSARGVWGGVSTDQSATPVTVMWKQWNKAPRDADPAAIGQPGYDDSSWPAFDAGSAPMTTRRGNAWFRGSFNVGQGQVDSFLETPMFALPPVRGQKSPPQPAKTIVYVNGQLLGDWVQDVSKILVPGKNTIMIEVQSRLGGESGHLSLGLWHNSPLAHATWLFHGGLNGLDETAIIGRVLDWDRFLTQQPWQPGNPASPNQPAFWRCTFNYYHPDHGYETVGLDTAGLKAGNVWLNGHNLGESPQNYPLYMPECWLRQGANDLVIFDLYGAKPNQLQMTRYEAFSVADGR
jgi:beta-galactosidase